MNNTNKHAFHWRGFIATSAALSFLGLCVTGMIMFVVPPGRTAHRIGWTLAGLSKHQWSGLHIWLGAMFIITAVAHLYFNRRVLLGYFKHKLTKRFAWRVEWITALVLFGIVVTGATAGIKPFPLLTGWKETIKHAWDSGRNRAGAARAELMPLHQESGRGTGLGRMTLRQYCDEFGLDLNSVIHTLDQADIKATGKMSIRDIADATGLHPGELRRHLE